MLTFSSYIRELPCKIVLSVVLLLCPFSGFAQISHGGEPLPLNVRSIIRGTSSSEIPFIEMPALNNKQAILRAESEQAKFKSFTFAHKFHVHFCPDNSGTTFFTENMKVWRVGIYSKKAYSINILFSKFRLPEGAKLFIYNADQTEILGAYTHENNTELNLLPVQPISGDKIIVEYQEPMQSAFGGEIEIGEVNHDFRGIFRATEPRDPAQNCHPNMVCYPEDVKTGSGVVALIINGNIYCTGVLVNNTANDGTPYLLTATHCINNNYNPYFLANRRYDMIAGTIVAFFGYQSPVCKNEIRGAVQMTVASADSVCISEKHDISLLKLKQAPPEEYQPFYLGWNVTSSPEAPFRGIHHPNGGNKKVAQENDALVFGSFTNIGYNMEPNSHWAVRSWDMGATEGGSSGSPLLDKNKRIVGTLTGGESMCLHPHGIDLYASLHKAWNVNNQLGNPHSLQSYLDPLNSQQEQIDGLNPHADTPYTRSHNFETTEVALQSYYNSIPIFATNNALGYTEFAEEFQATESTPLAGVFIASPITNDVSDKKIRIKVYDDNNGPGALLHEQALSYSFRYYENGNFYEIERDMRHHLENYLKFSTPVNVSGKFYIAYQEENNIPSDFSALNAEPRKAGSGLESTAWIKNATGWVRSSENMENPINTSLLISPYVIGDGLPPIVPDKFDLKVYMDGNKDLIIDSTRDLIAWEVFYISGQKLLAEKAENSIKKVHINTTHFISGIYLVKVNTNNEIMIRKIWVR